MLRVIRGGTGQALIGALADVLADPPEDPLAPEQVVVHSQGMERWLSQQLAGRLGAVNGPDGICANVDFPQPATVVGRLMAAAGVPPAGIRAWQPRTVAWRLLGLVDAGLPASLGPLRQRVELAGDRRLVPLTRVAEQLHRYALHRPDMVLDWLDGRDSDGVGGTLDPANVWQAEVVRTLADDIGHPTLPEMVVQTIARLDSGAPLPARLSRLSLFGFTALPSAQLAVLAALARRIDVTVLVLHPSPEAWAQMRDQAGTVDARGLVLLPARAPVDGAVGGNRLLRAWGRDVSELQALVQTVATPDAIRLVAAQATAGGKTAIARKASPSEGLGRGGTATSTLLGHLQAAVAADRPLADVVPEGQTAPLVADGSVQLHACHGRARQVQVLRDEILRMLAADDTLRPRDILVMCPDVEAFAPLIAAHLAGGGPDRPDLRVRLADRALKATNPVMRSLADILDIAGTRVTAGNVGDLLASEPVRRRFGLTAEDLETIDGWFADVQFRWGLDEADRAPFRLAGVADNTLQRGLARLLLGIAMADEDQRSIDGITPHDDVEGSDVRTVGRLSEFSHRLGLALTELRQPHTVAEWADVLGRTADRLLAGSFNQPGERLALTGLLQQLADEGRDLGAAVGLGDIRDLLADQLRGQPSRANHMTGDLTVCTLVPMRSVPHRVVCLLGMDDEAFPRRPHPHVDDLVSAFPRIGDADPRTEDRQLLLDALMAAGQTLLITYTGHDDQSGDDVLPCVPVAELVRVIDGLDTTSGPGRDGLADTLTVHHPLYAHDPAAFTPERPSFDVQAFGAAQVRPGSGAVADDPLLAPPDPSHPVDVEDLVRFAIDPAASFVRQVLGVWVPGEPESPEEHTPVDLVGLDTWKVAETLIQSDAVGDEAMSEQVLMAVRGRGMLPPEPLAGKRIVAMEGLLNDIDDHCESLGLPLRLPDRRPAVDLTVGGRRITGRVAGVVDDRVAEVSYSHMGGKQVMRVWVRLLVMTAADPDIDWTAVVVGRTKRGYNDVAGSVQFQSLGRDATTRRRTAETLLTDLLAMYDDGCREPLVAPAKVAHVYARARVVEGKPAAVADVDAALEWDPDEQMGWTKESGSAAHVLVLGDVRPYEYLADQPARPQDLRPGQEPEPHRLGGLAMRLWAPALARCREVTR